MAYYSTGAAAPVGKGAKKFNKDERRGPGVGERIGHRGQESLGLASKRR